MLRPDKISKNRTRRCGCRQMAMSQQNWLSCPKCDGQRNALPRRDRASSFGWPCCQYLLLDVLGQFEELRMQRGVCRDHLKLAEFPRAPLGVGDCAAGFLQ